MILLFLPHQLLLYLHSKSPWLIMTLCDTAWAWGYTHNDSLDDPLLVTWFYPSPSHYPTTYLCAVTPVGLLIIDIELSWDRRFSSAQRSGDWESQIKEQFKRVNVKAIPKRFILGPATKRLREMTITESLNTTLEELSWTHFFIFLIHWDTESPSYCY